MTELSLINGEALSVPGLRFRAMREGNRFLLVAQNDLGAVELWSQANPPEITRFFGEDSYGGVTVHSPTKLYDFSPEPDSSECHVLGGDCWSDGSSSAYFCTFLPLIKQRASAEILQRLADWHQSHFSAPPESE